MKKAAWEKIAQEVESPSRQLRDILRQVGYDSHLVDSMAGLRQLRADEAQGGDPEVVQLIDRAIQERRERRRRRSS